MLTDFYEITMANGYFLNGKGDTTAQFDMFFRTIHDNGGFAIMAGVEQLVEYLENLSFSDQDIEYLRGRGFCEEFLDYLKNFEFKCDIYSVPEGTPIFPREPIVTVKGPVMQAQFIETMVLLAINHQSLIATKANRITRAAQGRPIMEFGSRRAQGFDGAVYGARAAYIAGCAGTACTIVDREFGVPALGTMAHSWVQLFDSELEAFCAYAKAYPDDCTLLVDTYNVLKSGIPNAIEAFKREVLPRGFRPKGIRIVASNSLDEYIIRDMLLQGAKVDSFGVGERLITASSAPVFGGVYKLCAVEKDGEMIPKIKLSENTVKVTTPGTKKLWRLYDNESGKALADVITLEDETIDDSHDYEIFDPDFTWKRKNVYNFSARQLLQPLFINGKRVYEYQDIDDIKNYCLSQVDTLWDEVKRFENPHNYYVDLSQKLWDIKMNLIKKPQ